MENESKVGLNNTRKKQKVFSKCACDGYPASFVVVLDRSGKDIIHLFDAHIALQIFYAKWGHAATLISDYKTCYSINHGPFAWQTKVIYFLFFFFFFLYGKVILLNLD